MRTTEQIGADSGLVKGDIPSIFQPDRFQHRREHLQIMPQCVVSPVNTADVARARYAADHGIAVVGRGPAAVWRARPCVTGSC